MGKLLAMAKFMTGLDKVTRERLHKDLKVSSKVGDIACYQRTYDNAPQILDPHVMSINQSKTTSSTRSPRSTSRTRDTSNRGRSTSMSQRQNAAGIIECHKCHRSGHTYKQCYANIKCNNCQYRGHLEQDCRNEPWCEWHRRVGHKTADCRGISSGRNKQVFQGGTGTQPQI